VQASFGEGELAAVALRETRAKWVDATGLRHQLETLRRVWPELKGQLHRQLIPRRELAMMLRTAGAPVEPEEIGISRARLRESFGHAYWLRRRFTVLDLAVRCGFFEMALTGLFGPHGPWPASQVSTGEPNTSMHGSERVG
jgi:glycerol-1-phosphate dehydrogenase [NAD(P)+]